MARKPDDWMPLHIGAYHADTAHLTRDQHGAYLLLLMAYWRRGGPLPADDARLANIAKATTSEWRKLRPVLAEFFTEEDGTWKQKRADEELAKAVAKQLAKSEAGAKGAKTRWQNDSTAIADASICHRQNDAPLPSPLPVPSELTSLREVAHATRWASDRSVPSDWIVDAAASRKEHHLPEIDLDLEAVNFADYWSSKSGASATKKDWRRTWLKWAREARPRVSSRPSFNDPDNFKIIKVA